MKKFLFIFLLSISFLPSKADEGMWIPMLIGQHWEQMQKLGLKLSADDIYSVNKSSLKDAIVHFGRGCTGEMVSADGLLMTNHHCGYGNISALSTVQNNYLMNGFVAVDRTMELPCPGLSVKFLVRMEDVTDRVRKAIGDAFGAEVGKRLNEVTKELEKENSNNGQLIVNVKDYFSGNKYYMLIYEEFTDVRLVAAPPESLGKFGGDTDNWMWPRHTCDFSMFRVYSDNNNRPAAYSTANRPYHPRHHLPVSLKGVQDGDFAMVMGYPGRTTRYLTSYGIDMAVNDYNPSIVSIRDKRLAIMRDRMNADPAVDLAYSSTYASVANYWKYYIGQTEQLKKLKVYDKKVEQEKDFEDWARKDARYLKKIFGDYASTYADVKPYVKHSLYYREAFGAPKITQLALTVATLKKFLEPNAEGDVAKEISKIIAARKRILEGMDMELEKNLFAAMNLMFYRDVPKAQLPSVFSAEIFKNYGNDNWEKTFNDYANYIFSKSALLDDNAFEKLANKDHLAELLNDPAVLYAMNVSDNYENNYSKQITDYNYQRFDLDRAYMGGLLEKNANKMMYPDANSTMRVSYGNVMSYHPQDAVSFAHYTTADGLLEKYKAGDKEFDLPTNVVDLLKQREFGDYADKKTGNLITCFITNNDITGGNSGSPVINGEGEYIGSAFDGNWEAMSGDIEFDSRFKRTIIVDSRYIMWVIDKVLGGRALLDEMTIRN